MSPWLQRLTDWFGQRQQPGRQRMRSPSRTRRSVEALGPPRWRPPSGPIALSDRRYRTAAADPTPLTPGHGMEPGKACTAALAAPTSIEARWPAAIRNLEPPSCPTLPGVIGQRIGWNSAILPYSSFRRLAKEGQKGFRAIPTYRSGDRASRLVGHTPSIGGTGAIRRRASSARQYYPRKSSVNRHDLALFASLPRFTPVLDIAVEFRSAPPHNNCQHAVRHRAEYSQENVPC